MDLWKCGRSIPAGERFCTGCGTLERSHRLRDSGAASHRRAEEGSRASTMG
ncbi:MAG: zinc-ribbon domain-containing protein [Planctomycetaceae bacterium]|nr:zinc-ribbon domain-containing protein [Planctomycetaceae bacterium]